MTSEPAFTRWRSCKWRCTSVCCRDRSTRRALVRNLELMGISDRLLGKKNVNGHPHIEAVQPGAALPGGEVRILGKSLRPHELRRPKVQFGEIEASVLISSDEFLVARVPDG